MAKKHKSKEAREQAFREWLGRGAAREMRKAAAADLSEVRGPDRERVNALDHPVMVGPLLDPRLKLTPQQRAVGQTYGAYAEEMWGGGASWRVGEYVDSGTSGGGGYNERQFEKVRMVELARETIGRRKAIRYPLGKKRGKKQRGRHLPISPLDLVDEVCIGGHSLIHVGVIHAWTVQQGDRWIVPDRQKKWLAGALRDNLDAIGDAWADRGLYAPWGMSIIETE